MKGFYQQTGSQLRLQLFVQPKSSKIGWGTVVERDDKSWIQLKIAAPPVEGAANQAVIKYLSKQFKAPSSKIRIIQGEKSRYKTVAIEGYSEEKWRELLRAVCPQPD